MTQHNFYIIRRLPFSLYSALQEILPNGPASIVAIDHMDTTTLTPEDFEALATREDARFFFKVLDASDLDIAGIYVDGIIRLAMKSEEGETDG